MQDDRREATFSADRPLVDPKNDLLGYAAFAQRLAEVLARMAPQEGFVVAIHGKWGSGKTTLINFVLHHLESGDSDYDVVKFNPWWFEDREHLTRAFFDQLLVKITEDKWFEKSKRWAKGLREHLAAFADAVGDAPVPGARAAKLGLKIAARRRPKDVAKVKDDLASVLRKQKRRFLVVVDDIDRLHPEETRQVFRLIKAVGDLPRVTYLVAFDREVVARALSSEDAEGEGRRFLDKIVQVAFELPEPQKEALHRLALNGYEKLIGRPPEELLDKHHFANLYWLGVAPLLRTPRDVQRLLNFLRLTYPAVEGEVNPADFLGIETLRVFCPMAYYAVRERPGAFTFTGETDPGTTASLENRTEEYKRFHEAWLARVREADRPAVRSLLHELFPRWLSDEKYGDDWDRGWRRQLRVCHQDLLPTYFHLTLPPGAVSAQAMQTMLAGAGDPRWLADQIRELASPAVRLPGFVEFARQYTQEVAKAGHAANVIEALFACGDDLLRTETGFSGLVPLPWPLQWWTLDLLHALEENARVDTLHRCIEETPSIGFAVHTVRSLGRQHGRYGREDASPSDREALLPTDALDSLENVLLTRIRKAAQEGSLVRAAELDLVLIHWHEADGECATKTWVDAHTTSKDNLASIIRAFRRATTSHTFGNVLAETRHGFDTKRIQTYVDVATLAERARAHLEEGDVTEDEATLFRLFIRDAKRLEDRKRTDSTGHWDDEEE